MARPAVTTIDTESGFIKRSVLIDGAVPAGNTEFDVVLGPGRWMIAILAVFSAGGTGTLAARAVTKDGVPLSTMGMSFAATVAATVTHSVVGTNGGHIYVVQITTAGAIPAGIVLDGVLRITYVAGTTAGTAQVVLYATPMA